jgi:hypothetical protein
MVRNITSLKVSGKSLFRVKGAQYDIPREVALVVAQDLFGSKSVPNTSSASKLQSVLDDAYCKRIFSFKIKVLE